MNHTPNSAITETLREAINKERILQLGIIGNPLSHSSSPKMQNAGLKHLGVKGSYDKYELSQESFSQEFTQLLSKIDGLNVTIPFKEEVINYLNYIDPLVERVGAVNTIIIRNDSIEGYNTDYYGFLASIRDLNLEGKEVSILGAGGAAKAVFVALEDLGVSKITACVRNRQRAEKRIPKISKVKLEIKVLDPAEAFDFGDSSLLVNCTPVGQGRLSDELPITLDKLKTLQAGATVYDLIYSDTRFLKEARDLGYKTIDGSQMLLHQGVKSLTMWTGSETTDELIKAMAEGLYSLD